MVAALMLLASSPSRLEGLQLGARRGDTLELRWTASPESGVREYIVAHGPAGGQPAQSVRVREPRATLRGVPAGQVVSVKAVNERGLESWDWARLTVR